MDANTCILGANILASFVVSGQIPENLLVIIKYNIGNDNLVQSLAIIAGAHSEFLRNVAFWDHMAQNFGNKTVEPKFYIRCSPRRDRFKLHKLVIQIEWLNTFHNKSLRIFHSLVLSQFHLIRKLSFPFEVLFRASPNPTWNPVN